MQNADQRHFAVDKKLGEQASILMGNAYDDHDFVFECLLLYVDGFESSITEHEIGEWKVDRPFDVPAFELVLRSKVKNKDA